MGKMTALLAHDAEAALVSSVTKVGQAVRQLFAQSILMVSDRMDERWIWSYG